MSDGMTEMGRWEQLELFQKYDEPLCKSVEEKEYLDKLVNDHWKYIEGVLWASAYGTNEEYRIAEIEYHYKTSAKHFWGHAREYHVGETLK